VIGFGQISTCRRLKLDPCLSSCIKINSKWIKDLNIRPETLKQLQEAAGNTLEQTDIGNDSSDKGLISRVYRELKKLSPQRIKTSMKKWAHELNSEFSKEDIQMASKYMKNFSTSLVIKEIEIKNTT
jgi:hypothetical protein